MRARLLVLLVPAITTLIAVVVTRRQGVTRLWAAALATIELVGATALFFGANLVIGAGLVLVAPRLTGYDTTLYEVADVALLVLSLMQAAVFEGVRRRSASD